MDIFEKAQSYMDAKLAKAAGYYPYFLPLEDTEGTEVTIGGRRLLMIGSNNYLGLVTHPKVKEAAIAATKKYGVGCTGSRLLNGTLDLHLELEEKLAKFMRKEEALVYSTGMQTNLGTISALVNKGEYILIDRSVHASIVDGCRLSFGRTVKYEHNNMDDLERVLSGLDPDAPKLIVTDGVFSMEGDIAKLPRLVKLAHAHNARVMVDDAHALGVLGSTGAGTAEHFDLTDQVDITMGTFSKSLASIGGFIVGDAEVVEFVKHFSRTMIFSASIPPASAAGVMAALEILQNEPERRTRLWEITRRVHRELRGLGFDLGTSETPIVPILIGDETQCFQFWKMLTENGIFANAAVPPAVAPGQALIRTSYTANHTDEQIDRVLDTFAAIGKKTGMISAAV
ncbi:MAG: aminotransferase class I/II-fold pyridoxal phosphate-dependent enzyme [candidate division Zixibacteria bacterium]|nr:aminotransferase class I/II-fold pyridoxal phosphate-dependent enzyme [candidate division Zixibacteria bacterium]